MKLLSFFKAFNFIKWHDFAMTLSYCPICAKKRLIVRLQNNAISVRCTSCKATAVTMSLVAVLKNIAPDLSPLEAYELSSRGPLVSFLRKKCRKLTCSEYFDNVRPGEFHNGVVCQDVQKLTFADNSFDICTSTEVFEHVPDDLAGFREIRRVLKPGGFLIFTVPIFPFETTIERAQIDLQNKLHHIHPAQFHQDPIRGHNDILVFRDYGKDILNRLERAGFEQVQLVHPADSIPFNSARSVIIAY